MNKEQRSERNERLRQMFASGMSRKEIAAATLLCYVTVAKITRGMPRRLRPSARAERMMEMYRSGLTLEQIGQRYDITRERVRQIIRKYGCLTPEGGMTKRAAARRDAASSARDRRYVEKYGLAFAEWKAFSKAARNAFKYQKRSADSRGIEWRLTLKQWWDLWQESGHWQDRGRGRDRYCMARLHDSGAYEMGNAYITTNRENGQEYQLRRDRNKPKCDGVYLMYPGRPKSYMAKRGRKYLGCFATAEEARAAREATDATRTTAEAG